MSRGFTLIEVVVALVLLEIGVLGVVGTLLLATRTLTDAELTTRAAAAAALVADSLETHGFMEPGVDSFPGGIVRWEVVGDPGRTVVVATDGHGEMLVRIEAARP